MLGDCGGGASRDELSRLGDDASHRSPLLGQGEHLGTDAGQLKDAVLLECHLFPPWARDTDACGLVIYPSQHASLGRLRICTSHGNVHRMDHLPDVGSRRVDEGPQARQRLSRLVLPERPKAHVPRLAGPRCGCRGGLRKPLIREEPRTCRRCTLSAGGATRVPGSPVGTAVFRSTPIGDYPSGKPLSGRNVNCSPDVMRVVSIAGSGSSQ